MHAGEPIIDQWASWLAMDAPRRVSPATIREYCRHLARFASWIESTLGLPFLPEHVTAYRMERYLAEIEGQIQQKQRKHAMYNKAVAVLTSFGMWLVSAGYITETPARRLRTLPEQPTPIKALDRNVVIKVLDAAHHTGDLLTALSQK
jgi:site-specific recombinase XerD